MDTNQGNLNYSPRSQCLTCMVENEVCNPLLLTKKAFKNLTRKKVFEEVPFEEQFGKSTGEPYNPWRQAFGKIKKGLFVYCELQEESDKEVLFFKRSKTIEFKTKYQNKANLSAQGQEYVKRAERDLPGLIRLSKRALSENAPEFDHSVYFEGENH